VFQANIFVYSHIDIDEEIALPSQMSIKAVDKERHLLDKITSFESQGSSVLHTLSLNEYCFQISSGFIQQLMLCVV